MDSTPLSLRIKKPLKGRRSSTSYSAAVPLDSKKTLEKKRRFGEFGIKLDLELPLVSLGF